MVALLPHAMSTGLQSSGQKLSRDVKNGSLRAWLRARLASLGSPPRGVCTWLGLPTAGKLGSEREDLKDERYKEQREARSILKDWAQKSQDIPGTTVHGSEQSRGQPTFPKQGNKAPSPDVRRGMCLGEGRDWRWPSLRREAEWCHFQA